MKSIVLDDLDIDSKEYSSLVKEMCKKAHKTDQVRLYSNEKHIVFRFGVSTDIDDIMVVKSDIRLTHEDAIYLHCILGDHLEELG